MSKPSCRTVLSLLLMGAVARPGSAASPDGGREPLRIRVPAQAGMAVRRSVLSAQRRLNDEACRLVLTDFVSSVGGQSLEAVLRVLGRTPQAHLDSLVFKDGSGRPRCASAAILAFTHVGGDTVYVCSAQFTRVAERDPGFADVVLIHEALHTLGLGENPPTSGEITARVAERCGS